MTAMLFVAALGLMVAGVALIYTPAGVIAGGLALAAVAVGLERAGVSK
jgi:hypothetical protein